MLRRSDIYDARTVCDRLGTRIFARYEAVRGQGLRGLGTIMPSYAAVPCPCATRGSSHGSGAFARELGPLLATVHTAPRSAQGRTNLLAEPMRRSPRVISCTGRRPSSWTPAFPLGDAQSRGRELAEIALAVAAKPDRSISVSCQRAIRGLVRRLRPRPRPGRIGDLSAMFLGGTRACRFHVGQRVGSHLGQPRALCLASSRHAPAWLVRARRWRFRARAGRVRSVRRSAR